MNNPTVILNGDQVYCDELIRENARLTIQQIGRASCRERV